MGPRSSDLTPFDSFLPSYIKSKMYASKSRDLPQPEEKLPACSEVREEVLRIVE